MVTHWCKSEVIKLKYLCRAEKQLQVSNVIFLIWDTKCLMVGAVLSSSCKETVEPKSMESILRRVCSS